MLNLFVHLGCHGDETACVTVGTEVCELRLYRGGLAVAVKVDDEGQRVGAALIGRSLDCVATRFTGRGEIDCFPVQNLGGARATAWRVVWLRPGGDRSGGLAEQHSGQNEVQHGQDHHASSKAHAAHCICAKTSRQSSGGTHRVVRPLELPGCAHRRNESLCMADRGAPGSRNRLGGLPESGAGLAVDCWCEGSGPERAQIPWTFQKAAAPGAGGAVQSAWDTGFWAV